MSRLGIVCMVLVLGGTASSQESAPEVPDVTEMVNTFADCAGFWHVYGQVQELNGKPASAKQAAELKNGAEIVAQYLLATDYQLRKGKAKTLGSFAPYVEGRSETVITSLMASIENDDTQMYEMQAALCSEMLPIQQELIQQMRDEFYREK